MDLRNYFYQSSKHLSDARLSILRDGEERYVDIFSFVNELNFDYRSVLTVECVDDLAESSRKHLGGDLICQTDCQVDLPAGVTLSNVVADVSLPDVVRHGGHFGLHISACRYVPLIGANCTEEEYVKRGVVYSEILFIHLTFCRGKKNTTPLEVNKFIYESYDQLGFIGVDEALFSEFIAEKLGHGTHDLVESFTTTEIASDLFQAGLMILCWGITPWVYMINSVEKNLTGPSFPADLSACQRGAYYFREDIKEISLMPGVALKAWNTDIQGTWPKLKLNGTGRFVQVDLCVAKAINPYAASMPDYLPMPFFNFNRVDSLLREPMPILSADIKSCMS